MIDAAREADAVNRAGQLRMLSQRLVKLQALLAGGTDGGARRRLLAQTVERTDSNLARLADDGVAGHLWRPAPADPGHLEAVAASARAATRRQPAWQRSIAHAEKLLHLAEQLTASLELGENGASLHLVNLTGRQRMLSQRVAKLALIGALAKDEPARAARDLIAPTAAEFEASLRYLEQIPLTTEETQALLTAANGDWAVMLDECRSGRVTAGSPCARRRE